MKKWKEQGVAVWLMIQVVAQLLVVGIIVIRRGEAAAAAGVGIGVNWGTLSQHRLPAKTVVDLLKRNKISKMKLFDADPQVLNALRGSRIQVMVGIPNDFLSLLSSSPPAADSWVRHNLSAYISSANPSTSADIRSVLVCSFHFFRSFFHTYFYIIIMLLAHYYFKCMHS